MEHYAISFNKDGEEVFSPRTLKQMCRGMCAPKVKSFLFEEEKLDTGTKLTLKGNLPRNILESILEECDHCDPDYVPMMLELCKNVMLDKISLTRINLNNCRFLMDSEFEEMMKIKPTSLEIHDCLSLTTNSFNIINKYGENLESLNFGSSSEKLISTDMEDWIRQQNEGFSEWDLSLGLLNTPKLRRLTIGRVELTAGDTDPDFLEGFTRGFVGQLEHLDLSFSGSVQSLDFLLKAKNSLKFLNLNTAVGPTNRIKWNILTKFEELTFLDIGSCKIDDWNTGVLTGIVESLKNLTHLDISKNRLRVSEDKDNSGQYKINALASRKFPLEFVNLYETGTSHCPLVPARAIVRDEDTLLDDLVTVIRGYNETKDLPPAVINRLEIISKKNTTGFPWKEAVNLVIQVAGPNLFHFYSDYQGFFVFPFACDALKESQQLAPWQVDQMLKCVVSLLNQDCQFLFELKGAIQVLPKLSRSMELWSLQNAKSLVAALLQAAISAIDDCKRDIGGDQTEDVDDCASILRSIGKYLSNDLSDRAVARIRALELDQKIVAVTRQVTEFELQFRKKGVSVRYWKICDKIVLSKLGY